MNDRILVVGSYPPVPVAGAPVTLAEVRRAWAAGDEVTVVSPRLSAAHLAVPVYGLLGGRRLDNLRRHTGARRLVLVVEPGYPLPPSRAQQAAAAAVLARSLRGFQHVRLVRAGSGPFLDPRAWSRLASAADEVSVEPAGPAADGVTPLGPPEEPVADRVRRVAFQITRTVGKRVLGRRAPLVRARLASLRRAVRR